MNDSDTFFSIIVPVYNGAATLSPCLEKLTNQAYPQEKYEVIVVNDGSTDNTAQIAQHYPVKLIDLPTNQGRVVARNVGAEAARFDMLVFNDVRVFSDTQLLVKLNQYDKYPLMPDISVYEGQLWGFPRMYHLLRCKVYGPYYPSSDVSDYLVTPENFDQVPKGATVFVCPRDIWLISQPDTTDKMTNDDTRILKQIVQHQPIYRTRQISAKYNERTELKQVIPHAFMRGPRFADFYLGTNGRYRPYYLLIWAAVAVAIISSLFYPTLLLLWSILFVLGLFGLAIYLSQHILDLLVVMIYFPILIVSFGSGILIWQIRQIVNIPRRLIDRSPKNE